MRMLLLLLVLFPLIGTSQNEQLAQHYFDKGEFEKAILTYTELLKTQPGHSHHFQRIVESHQQLEQLDKADALLQERMTIYKHGYLHVELGYNEQLRGNTAQAQKHYEAAMDRIRANPNESYAIANVFERRSLLQQALSAYELASEKEPRLNFNYQRAVLYGQLGQIDRMIDTFLDEAYRNPSSAVMVQNQLSRFLAEDDSDRFKDTLRRVLLSRAQKDQDIFWNQYLSWFYVQQKEYGRAFVLEKAIYRRSPENFDNIVNLAQLALAENERDTAKEILGFVLENTADIEVRALAHYQLMKMRTDAATPKQYDSIHTDFVTLTNEIGENTAALRLRLLHAHFLAFQKGEPAAAREILNRTMQLPLQRYQLAMVKMEMADIFVLEQQFNQGLIFYAQIEEDLKNDAIGHEASLKSARTSYFKGDFKWAEAQFKTLKSASTQLIANDALEYYLLMADAPKDSLQTALKAFAHADYLQYQNKIPQAKQAFEALLLTEDDAAMAAICLLRLGEIYAKEEQFDKALSYFGRILSSYSESIYRDEAYFYSGNIYEKQGQTDLAKTQYEKIIFEHPDSIHFVEARLRYRKLRGDVNL